MCFPTFIFIGSWHRNDMKVDGKSRFPAIGGNAFLTSRG